MNVIDALSEFAKANKMEISAMSWNGFNLAGDRASICELSRLLECEARMIELEERLCEIRSA